MAGPMRGLGCGSSLVAAARYRGRRAHHGRGVARVMFDYLGEEVFGKFPKAIQSQLYSLAVLPRIPADAANDWPEPIPRKLN